MEYGKLVVLGYSSYRVAPVKNKGSKSSLLDLPIPPPHFVNNLDSGMGMISSSIVAMTPPVPPVSSVSTSLPVAAPIATRSCSSVTSGMSHSDKSNSLKSQLWEPVGDQNLQFLLHQRQEGNGIKLKKCHLFIHTKASKAKKTSGASIEPHRHQEQVEEIKQIQKQMLLHLDQDKSQESGSYLMCVPLNDQDASMIVTEYFQDDTVDMFQIGRMPCKENDFVIPGPRVGTSGTISRFAARIICSRQAPFECRLYAGGFDTAKKMLVQANSLKQCHKCGSWTKRLSTDHSCIVSKAMETKAHHRKGNQLDPLIQAVIDASQDKKNKNPFQHTEYSTSQEDICVDGLTKNGVRLYLPDMKQWFEVSVNGCMYPIELKAPATSSSGSKSARDSTFNRPNCQQRSSHISNLFNGCIIDLGGIQLQFRSPVKSFVAQGEAAMITDGDPNKSENVLATVVSQLEKLNVQCPVQLHSLSFKAPDEGEVIPLDQIPHVFPACGHVFGYEKRLAKSKQCPMCRKSGHLIKLLLKENSELVRPEDRHVIPECVFNPCGHAVPNTFAQQYAQIIMPNGRSICPFCGVHLDVQKPFSRLYLYSDNNTTDHVSISLTN